MNKNIKERVQQIIDGVDAVVTNLDDKVEIKSGDTFDATDIRFEVDGGLFDEKAFGDDWRELSQGYEGQEDYLPLDRIPGDKNYGAGGYIRLHKPLNLGEIIDRELSDLTPDIETIGILPAEFRPIIEKGNRLYVHPLTKAYSDLIRYNNRIPRLIETGAPAIILESEYNMLKDSIRYVLNSISYYYDNGSESACMLVNIADSATRYANSIDEIGAIVGKNLDEADKCIANKDMENAQWYVDAAIIHLNRYRQQCTDISPIKNVIVRAIELDEQLKNIQ